MIAVAEYRNFAAQCREMAVRTDNPLDRKALQIQAAASERIANERETVLKRGEIPKP
ncbi:MAG TPA: hypothetical protein VHU22_24435 [Xanthobacteraceae bacterium]|jgi:hypothetical protein|nr:hypothetical protein [Xanthobacteraceae bacterium]